MRKAILLAALIMATLTSLPARAETKLMVVSDTHYLAPSLYRDSGLFLRALRSGDGKAAQYGEELLSALYGQIRAERPDALIVTGDLSFNGERKSHEALAAWLGTVEETGVPVWVIPGNHDINVVRPVGFDGDTYHYEQAVTPEEFAAIYADFLLPGSAGFSYAVPVGEDLLVAMTDVAVYRDSAVTPGLFTSRHAVWLEDALAGAGDRQAITATHHSLVPHTEFSKESFLMYGHESMLAIARRHGVRLNLSGHLHIQHVSREDGLYDAALGAFSMWPHRYAVVTADGGALTYEAKSLDPAFLPEGLPERTREWFEGVTMDKTRTAALTGTEAEKTAMTEFAARFNLAYFSGTFRADDPAWTEDPARALWEGQEDRSFREYMALVEREKTLDNLHITLGRDGDDPHPAG